VIVHIDGDPATRDQLDAAKRRAGYDGTVNLDVVRRGKKVRVPVTVGTEAG